MTYLHEKGVVNLLLAVLPCALLWCVMEQLDLKTQGVWNGHPRHYVIDNRSDFEGKMQRVERLAAKLVGLPHLPRVGHRFKLLAVSAEVLPPSPPMPMPR